MGKTIKEILLQLIPLAVGVYTGILGGICQRTDF